MDLHLRNQAIARHKNSQNLDVKGDAQTTVSVAEQYAKLRKLPT
jgi:hypothetical protein